MAETATTPRLMAAAKEFNIGKETLVDFLVAKGFSKDDLKPTSKLTEEMYRSLQMEFQSDKVAKLKSDQIDLPKGSLEVKKVEKPEPVVEEKAPEEPVKPVIEEKKVEEKPEIVKLEAPEIEGPKIVDKIDLSAIDSSTRPKKTAKKKEVEKPEEEIEIPKEEPVKANKEKEIEKEEAPVVAEKKQVVPEPEPQPEEEKEETPPVIENIKAEKLEGPKILGKIQLPVGGENRPKPNEEKRKRKRIPIEKKDNKTPQQRAEHLFKKPADQQQRQGQHGGHQQGGGNFRRDNRGGHGHNRGGGGRPIHREVKEIDEKEIQNKIRETQAKLAGTGGRGKSLKAKYRREKRQGMAEQAGSEELQDNKLQVTEFISVSELANLMDVNFADVISKCMSLGLMVSINQRLDAEVIELVAGEFGYTVEFIDMEKQMEMEEEEEGDD